jgi:SAM-dependent methyltransferase
VIDTTTTKVREHYAATGLTDLIGSALTTIAPEDQTLTVAQLAPLDQFHLRGILATKELADAAGLEPSSRVLDIGCGIGGPARYLAATFGSEVTGVDLSPGFIDAATYLTVRCALSDRVTFQVGDALHLHFEDGTFDAVFLQHVARTSRTARLSMPRCVESWRGVAGLSPTTSCCAMETSCIRCRGRLMLRPAFCSARSIRERRWSVPGIRRCSGATTARPCSTGSRRPSLVRRRIGLDLDYTSASCWARSSGP